MRLRLGLMSTIDHLSVSMIQQFDACPNCWVSKYIYHRKMPPYQPFIDGKRWHENVDNYHIGKPYEDFIHNYVEKYPVNYRIKSELRMNVNLTIDDWKCPLPVTIIVDGVTEKGLCDLKFSASKPNTTKNLQAILYSQVYFNKKGYYPEFMFNWVQKKKDKDKNVIMEAKRIENVGTEVEPKDIVWLKKKLQDFIRDIQQPIPVLKSLPARTFMNTHFDDCPNKR